ncbi:Na+/H+ antiporter subunit E [Streptomyces prasinus]|uniref:Na+/H+ antiporter subunit E n=2 Tax=Streptomyces prasinus TaxID=67345 RepID=A0ABX6B0S7_9ACTN|nr:Na+/H+ antiporter subunit E [Streptomyces prasinus]QEV08696.1 Na+/H+ antiporter subunit E [Streptomyces prasinus]
MTRRESARRVRHHWPMVGWLWLLWVLLWGSVGPVVLVGGLLVAVAVVRSFSLPPILPGAVPRPLAIGRLLAGLLEDIVVSGATVAWQALRYGERTSTAIVEVPLRVDSDLLITAVAELTTIAPGTLVVEIDRRRQRLYVHALPVRDEADVDRRREAVQTLERRVARAVGRGRRTGSSGDDTSGAVGDLGYSADPGYSTGPEPSDHPDQGGSTP